MLAASTSPQRTRSSMVYFQLSGIFRCESITGGWDSKVRPWQATEKVIRFTKLHEGTRKRSGFGECYFEFFRVTSWIVRILDRFPSILQEPVHDWCVAFVNRPHRAA